MFKKFFVLGLLCNILFIEAVEVRYSRKAISNREASLSSAKKEREKRTARGSCSEFTPCRCRSKRTVACTKADCMQRLPSFRTTRQEGERIQNLLVTRQSNFTTIGRRSLYTLPNLRSIRLYNNGISAIHRQAFQWTPNVERLDLHKNKLMTFPQAIEQLERLQTLNLGGNRIESLPQWAFSRNSQLKHLILRRNNFHSFPGFLPRGLVKLSIGANRISQIADLREFTQLEILRLESNRISRISDKALPASLRELTLCNNSLSSIVSFSFDDLHNLTKLRLAMNPEITEIHQDTFALSANRLRLLDLSGCGIRLIDSKAFSCLPRLRVVRLRSNQLSSYDPEWFSYNHKIRQVSLSGNPWSCNCAFKQQLDDLTAEAEQKLERLNERLSARMRRPFNYAFKRDFSNVTCTRSEYDVVSKDAHSSRLSDIEDCVDDVTSRWNFKPSICHTPQRATAIRGVLLDSSTSTAHHRSTTLSTTNSTLGLLPSRATSQPTSVRTSTTTISTTTTGTTPVTTRKTTETTRPTITTFRPTTATSPKITTTSLSTTSTTAPATTTTSTTSSSTTTTLTTTTSTTTSENSERMCTKGGDECVFPFEYQGKTYTTCAVYEGWTGTYTWCYTDANGSEGYYCKAC